MHLIEISKALDEYAKYLEADGRPGYSATVGNASENIRQAENVPPNPADIDGIGPTIRDIIVQLEITGEIEECEKLKEEHPYLEELSEVRGVGPNRARAIYDEFGITTVEELLDVDLREVSGIGEKTEQKLRREAKRL